MANVQNYFVSLYRRHLTAMLANAQPDHEISSSLKKGDVAAFEHLYKTHWFKLYCIACKYTGSPQDAEELVQSLFEKIWRTRETLTVRNWGAFLAVSLRNLIIDWQRQKTAARKLMENYPASPSIDLPEDNLYHQQLGHIIDSFVRKLPRKTSTIFRLSRYEHKSVKEIAGHLHLTEKAVEYHITKSLKLLKDHLRNLLHIFFTFL